MNNKLRLIISIGLSHLAGIVGSIFTAPNIEPWYSTLTKPAISPPNWIFSPVWLSLYTLMGIALYLIWKEYSRNKAARIGFWIFIIHLVVNALWSYIFFGTQNIFLGFINIIVILAFIVILMIQFWKINRKATYLLVPYLVWVSFATILNFLLWRLN